MAHKRPPRTADDPPRKRRKSQEKPGQKTKPVGSGDPLGKLVKEYGVNLAEVLLVTGLGGLIGGGIIWYALSRDPDSVVWLLIGAAVAVAAAALLGYSLLNLGRRLELRKLGLRWTEYGTVTELAWSDIADIEIHRQDETYLGIASTHKRSSDGITPTGPLTKSEWDITIHSHDGRAIRLRPLFLRTVPDPQKLISQLRLADGLR